MEKLLTISVAAYQMEDYLEETLKSFLIPEIMEEIEVIVVDDGSSDRTGEIGKAYEKKYPQTFRYIYQENGGHGAAVNRGIAEAEGLYFKTVDGDDFVEKKGLKALVGYLKMSREQEKSFAIKQDGTGKSKAVLERAEVVVTDFWQIDSKTKKKIKKCSCAFLGIKYMEKYEFQEIAKKTYLNMHAITYLTEILKAHPPQLDHHCFYVDAEYALFPMRYVKTVVFLPQPVYLYRLGREEQSMELRSMQKNCHHHEKVLKRVLGAYQEVNRAIMKKEETMRNEEEWPDAGENRLSQREIEAEQAVEYYFAWGAAKLAASQIKIYLSYPVKKENREKIVYLDKRLKKNYPLVYASNENKAVRLLRITGFLLYPVAAVLVRRKLRPRR